MKKILFAFCTTMCIVVGIQNNCKAQCDCYSYTECKQYAEAYKQQAERQGNGLSADPNKNSTRQLCLAYADQYERCAEAYARNMSNTQRDQLDLQRQQLELQKQQYQQQQEMYRYYRYGF